MPFIAAGGALLGGLLQGNSAQNAARQQADAQMRAAQLAAEEARFRPVGVTTRFGTSQFQTGPDGRVSGAGYTLDPALRAYQDRFMALSGQGLTQAEQAQQQFAPLQQAGQSLFGLGQQYLNQPADQRLGGIANQYLGAQPDFGIGQIGQRLLSQGQDQQLTDIARQQFSGVPTEIGARGAEFLRQGQDQQLLDIARQQFNPVSTDIGARGAQFLNQGQDQQLVDIARQQLTPSAGAQALTSLGQQYVAQSPQQAAQQYMASQQELLAPSRERQMAQLQNTLFQQGRGGLSVGATGARPSGAAGLGATTPELEAYYNAQAQQDAGLAAQAQQAGQQQASFGAGLLGQGQALGQSQIGFGAGILNQQQAAEAQRASFGAGLTAQQQALGQSQVGFGADLISRQQAAEAQRVGLGAGLTAQQQALGQGQIGFGAGLLSQQQAQEAQRLGLGSAFTAQQQALEQGRYGFGSDLLARQQAMDQGRASFGAGLFGTGGNLITQGYQGQVGALSPYQAYLQGATGLESLGQQSLEQGINIGTRGMSPSAANALYGGGMAAAGSNAAANAYNPFATALQGASQNPQLANSISNLFGGGRSPGFVDYTTTGNASSLSPYYQNRLYGSFGT
jgi:hypothetical protein